MPRLLSPKHKPSEKMVFVAVAIHVTGRHIALLYRLRNDNPTRMLHLAWDHDLRDELFASDKYYWTHLAIHPSRAKQVAHYCSTVKPGNPNGISYSFTEPFGRFNPDGTFIRTDEKVGLTCASFVVSVLEHTGVNLIDRTAWGRHCDDALFFSWVIRAMRGEIEEHLRAKRPDHPAALQAQVDAGAYRYQPMQVAGAATSKVLPVSFPQATDLAEEVRKQLPQSAEAMTFYLEA